MEAKVPAMNLIPPMPSAIRKKTSGMTAARKLKVKTVVDTHKISSVPPPLPPVSGSTAMPTEFLLLPKREEQTADRLRPESEQWANHLRRTEGISGQNPEETLLMHLARSNFYNAVRFEDMDPATSATSAKYLSAMNARGCNGHELGDATPIQAILSMLSAHLENDANAAYKVQEARLQLEAHQKQQETKGDSHAVSGGHSRAKYATADDGPLANYRRNMPALSQEAEERSFDAFYAEDRFDDTRPFGIDADPSAFPMFLEVTAKYARHLESMQNGAYDRNISDIPLPEIPDPIPRAYILVYRFPPKPGDKRLCISGVKCLFNLKWGPHAYIGREFRLPGQPPPEPDEPIGFCFDCLLLYIHARHEDNVKNGTIPTEPIHKFTVIKGRPGEYSDRCMLPIDKPGNQITGIVGPVPYYSRAQRCMQPIPYPIIKQLGLSTATGRPHYLAEVNMDFPPASAVSTAASFPTS